MPNVAKKSLNAGDEMFPTVLRKPVCSPYPRRMKFFRAASIFVAILWLSAAGGAVAATQGDGLDVLFRRLEAAQDDLQSRLARAAILSRLSHSNSDTVDLLAARAIAAEAAGAPDVARELLDYVVSLAPEWSDGFVRRARVRATAGEDFGAIADLEAAIRIEPRRFDALEMLGLVAERAGEKKQALDAYRRAQAIDPRNEDVRKNAERLRIEVEGRDI